MKHRSGIFLPLFTVLGILGTAVVAFLPSFRRPFLGAPTATRLFSGFGIATNYTWVEEPLEIEVSVEVPPDTKSKDIVFQALPKSIDLRLKHPNGTEEILLDKSRRLKGKVQSDGTFWVISDDDYDRTKSRKITVTIEKMMKPPKDDFEVIEYDWKGVYENDDEEVSTREYAPPEELNVREYAASLGVDIDNINMSMVDKSMFSSGLNMTKSTMDQLSKAGYVKEVTQQGDGSEYTFNDEGEAVPFSRLGDTVGKDELEEAAKIPFLDTESPWNKQSVPVDEIQVQTDSTRSAGTVTTSKFERQAVEPKTSERQNGAVASDPIESLTVKRLKEILREQDLKVSGTKQELQDRLRAHVQNMVKDQNAAS